MCNKDFEIKMLVGKIDALKDRIAELELKNEKLIELLSLTTNCLLEEFSVKGDVK